MGNCLGRIRAVDDPEKYSGNSSLDSVDDPEADLGNSSQDSSIDRESRKKVRKSGKGQSSDKDRSPKNPESPQKDSDGSPKDSGRLQNDSDHSSKVSRSKSNSSNVTTAYEEPMRRESRITKLFGGPTSVVDKTKKAMVPLKDEVITKLLGEVRQLCSIEPIENLVEPPSKLEPKRQLGMPIYAETINGTLISLEVEPSDTILMVKEQIYEKEGIPPDNQRLIYSRKNLKDDDSLSDCDIREGCKLRLLLRLRGGMQI